MKRTGLLLFIMMAAGTATFLYAMLRKLDTVDPYARPKGGERISDFETFIG